jgi:hypothetical protein
MNKKIGWAFVILALILSSTPYQTVRAENISVTTTEDTLDADINCISIIPDELPGPDGVTSLREAICAANNNGVPDTITFDLTCDPYCVIEPEVALPIIIDDHTTIDGGGTPATETTPATFEIVLWGHNVINHNGLTIASADNVIKGLLFYEFGINGIAIAGQYATGNEILGNCLGIPDQTSFEGGNRGSGVFISLGASDNTIGGDTPAERNIISGNDLDGVSIHGPNSTGNIVSGNFIGTDQTGTIAVPNTMNGVRIYGEAHDNTIGGALNGQGNLISANTQNGVLIYNATSNNVVKNYIGVDVSGTQDLGNDASGIRVEDEASDNFINGNLISGNDTTGVRIVDLSIGNIVSSNYIGTDASGTFPLGNNGSGIYVASDFTTIGGELPTDGNLISDNSSGITIHHYAAENTLISYNSIGTDKHGNPTLGNRNFGIYHEGFTRETFNHDQEIRTHKTRDPQPAEVPVPEDYVTLVVSNRIAGNGEDGIHISAENDLHFFTENSIFANQLGIWLAPGVNGGIEPPVINATNHGSITIQGTACPGCTVEIFENRVNDHEGEIFIGDTIADAAGNFSLTLNNIRYPYLTATATDEDLGTSPFSLVFEATTLGTFNIYLPLVLQP